MNALHGAGVARIAIADPIKRILHRGLGLSVAQLWGPLKGYPCSMTPNRLVSSWVGLREQLAEELGEATAAEAAPDLAQWICQEGSWWSRNRTPRELL
jgi:hypothetical protein